MGWPRGAKPGPMLRDVCVFLFPIQSSVLPNRHKPPVIYFHKVGGITFVILKIDTRIFRLDLSSPAIFVFVF